MTTLKDATGNRSSGKQAVGIEVEVEFMNPLVLKEKLNWVMDTDNSLRNHGYEFKTPKAITLDSVEHFINPLCKLIQGNNPIVTNRTSIHVHVNCLGLTHMEIINALIFAWIIEPYLFDLCAKHRLQSRFCLPIRKTPQIMKSLKSVVDNIDPTFSVFEDTNKYTATAYHNLRKIGTVEFRMLDGRYDEEFLNKWVKLLADIIYKGASFASDPQELVAKIFEDKEFTPKEIVKNLLGPAHGFLYEKMDDNLTVSEDVLHVLVPLIYGIDWDLWQKSMKKRTEIVPKKAKSLLDDQAAPAAFDQLGINNVNFRINR